MSPEDAVEGGDEAGGVEEEGVSNPTDEELAPMEKARRPRDDEQFHAVFDQALEAKLRQLDPEWMEAMSAYYEASGMDRWCA